jgi:uncharacterized protein YgfB (UPF0149 family)
MGSLAAFCGIWKPIPLQTDVEYDHLDSALRRCGATWDAAQAHGLLSARLAMEGMDCGFGWLAQVLEGTDEMDALRTECEAMLRNLFESTSRQLAKRQSEFAPLLPDDSSSTAVRTAALAHWCEAFLHGLVSAGGGDDDLKARLAAEPMAEIIKDLLQMTRAGAVEADDAEADEAAYAEIVEYLRVAAQLTYEELADIRHRKAGEDGQNESLH